MMSGLGSLYQDGYAWRHFDNASAEVAALSIDVAEAGITGTTEGIVFQTTPQAAGDALLGRGGFWQVGKAIRLWVAGTITTTAAGTLVVNCRLNSVSGNTLGASLAITVVTTITNATWVYEEYVVCRSLGTAGTLWGQGKITFNSTLVTTTSPGRTWLLPDISPATATINTTISNSLVVTALWSLAGNTMTTQQGFAETLN
jgi:hypothetical protein